MNTMNEQRHALRVWDPARLVPLFVMVLVAAILGALALHHADSVEAVSAVSPTAATVVASSDASGTAVAETFAHESADGWIALAISGCVALGLCCVIGLALAVRSANTRRDDSSGTLIRTVLSSMARWDAGSAIAARPSLDSLSISRT